MNELKHIEPTEIAENNIKLIGKDWMLVTSADRDGSLECGKDYNTMTASWGGVGVGGGQPSATCYIRKLGRNGFPLEQAGCIRVRTSAETHIRVYRKKRPHNALIL